MEYLQSIPNQLLIKHENMFRACNGACTTKRQLVSDTSIWAPETSLARDTYCCFCLLQEELLHNSEKTEKTSVYFPVVNENVSHGPLIVLW